MSGGIRAGDGALLVDKPAGPTSHDVVARVRKLFHARTVGHTGTLDPFATGLLVLVLGAATRLARWAERRRKVYRATVRLGQTTTTDDLTGSLVAERTPAEWPSLVAVGDALAGLTGTQHQRPPAYSAKLIAGVRSYRLARKAAVEASAAAAGAGVGQGRRPMELPRAVEVTVYRLELVEYRPPLVTLRAEVSPGTYLRAVGRDLGDALGTGAHLTELRREQVGSWRVADAHPLAALTGGEPLLPVETLVDELPRVPLGPDEARAARHGRDVVRPDAVEDEAALCEGDRLVAVARRVTGGWHPAVVLPEGAPAAP